MTNPVVSITKNMSSLDINRGEWITLWLDKGRRYIDPRNATQLDVMIRDDGTIELFCDTPIEVKPFWEYKSKTEAGR